VAEAGRRRAEQDRVAAPVALRVGAAGERGVDPPLRRSAGLEPRGGLVKAVIRPWR
jgi:hypothetical protein